MHHDVGALARRGHDSRIGLIGTQYPLARLMRRFAELDVSGDQPWNSYLVVQVDEPDLVQQRPHRVPGRSVQQQVVALGDHEGNVGFDDDRVGHRSTGGTVISRREDRKAILAADLVELGYVGGDVEGVRSTLAVASAEAYEVVVQHVEAVHWRNHARRHAFEDRRGHGRLAGARTPGNTEQ